MSQGSFHRTRFNRIFRYSSLTLAALAVAGQLFSVVHFALVQHVTCAEHGELIEAGAATVQAPRPADFSTATVSSAAAESHGHDHCVIALGRRQQARAAAGLSTPLAPAPAHDRHFAAIHSFSKPPIDILFIAPKNSPPV